MTEAAKGVSAILAACVIWGFATIYYKVLSVVPPLELLAHRTVWTLLLFAALLGTQGRLPEVWRLILGPQRWRIALTATTISFNWGLFIWAVQAGHAVEAGLGYYIFPLMAVSLGVIVLHERLTRGQGVAVALATLAVAVLTWGLGVAPWIAVSLAASFSVYGLIKKRLDAPAAVSIAAEVLLISPFALLLLAGQHLWGWQGGGAFGRDLFSSLLLPLAGLITGVPLMLFTWGAQRVQMSTLGLAQYLNPTLQVLVAVVIFGEPFTRWHGLALALIWAALALYSAESLRQEKLSQDRAARSRSARPSTVGKTEN